MKNPTLIAIIATLVIGVGFLGFLIVTQDDEIKESSDIAQIAERLGMDVDQFIEDYESQEIIDIVEAHEQEGLDVLEAAGEGRNPQTPTIAINGAYYQRLQGVTLVDELNNRLDSTEDLPIVVDVYEDYNCGACATFQIDLYEASQAFSTDQVVINKKHMPFLQSTSDRYARAAEAAKLQGDDVFEEYNIELYLLNHSINYDFYPFTEEVMQEIIEDTAEEVNGEVEE